MEVGAPERNGGDSGAIQNIPLKSIVRVMDHSRERLELGCDILLQRILAVTHVASSSENMRRDWFFEPF